MVFMRLQYFQGLSFVTRGHSFINSLYLINMCVHIKLSTQRSRPLCNISLTLKFYSTLASLSSIYHQIS